MQNKKSYSSPKKRSTQILDKGNGFVGAVQEQRVSRAIVEYNFDRSQ